MVRLKSGTAAAAVGVLEPTDVVTAVPHGPGTKPRVRDRIFDTACALFYRHGIREVGVEEIATEAGTNKMSFYRSFPSKDELIAEYLRDQGKVYWQWWDSCVQPHAGNPRKQLEALFDSYVNKTCGDDSRGCALANASVELVEETHPGRKVALDTKIEMRRRLQELARECGARKWEELGDALMLLMEGGYLTRLNFRCGSGPIQHAGAIARVMMDAYGAKKKV